MALAQADLTGWYIGWGIGIPVILVVAALVLGIIVTAFHIAAVAADGTQSLVEARDRSEALWQIKTTNQVTADIIDGATQARKALGG
jgi:hypothetical protein